MVSLLAALVLVQADTSTYADSATAELILKARQRHEYQDRLVEDYSALVRTRIDVGFGRSRFARIPPVSAYESVARVTWAMPNDLKVSMHGERSVSVFSEGDIEAAFDSPWFIPRSLGDSIRFVDDELPATAALHPLAAGAAASYHYAIHDSLTLALPGRTVNAVGVRVRPKGKFGPSLIAGDIWLDAQTAEIVRMMFVYVGEYLWDVPEEGTPDDSASVRTGNTWASRILKLEADLEYALYESRYWMPYRQLLQLTVSIPWFVNVTIPVRFATTFEDYEVNTSRRPVFEVPTIGQGVDDLEEDEERVRRARRCPPGVEECDSRSDGIFRVGRYEGGGRWEMHYPPRDSLRAYVWDDDLSLELDPEDEERIKETIATLGDIQEQLPSQWVGRMNGLMAWDSFSDLFRYNRVQGPSLGVGYQIRPGAAFTTLNGRIGFGFSDQRVTGSVSWQRDAPTGRLEIEAFRKVREAGPWTRGLGFGNSMNGVFAGHDDADYLLALGGGIHFASYAAGLLRNAEIGIWFEREFSMVTESRSSINDLLGGTGQLPENAPIVDGNYLRSAASRRSSIGPVDFQQGVDVLLRTDDDSLAARVWGVAKTGFRIFDRRGAVTLRGGHLFGHDIEQMWFRVGGPQTVRGYQYGARRGRSGWSAQLDLALTKRDAFAPVLFADVGGVKDTKFFPTLGSVPGTEPLVGVGGGLSFLSGLIRLNVAKGLNPVSDLRFDLLFTAPR